MIATRCPNKECESEGLPFVTATRLVKCPCCDTPIPAKEIPVSHKVLTAVTEQASTNLIGELVCQQNEVHQLYNNLYGFLSANNQLLKSKSLSDSELCDFGFICRELEKVLDELRKEVKSRQELCGKTIAFRLTQRSLTDSTIKMRVEGQFATATPDCKMQAALPKKQSPEYYQLTDFLGVPRSVAEQGVLKLDWKQVTEYLTGLMHNGKQIPPGFGQQYPQYTCIYRKKKC